MNQFFIRICALFLLCGTYMQAHALDKQSETRGQLLYLTNCSACHSTEIHWREKKLVTDWSSLKQQVRRWQAIAGLKWTDADIDDVAHYLNTQFYSYQDTAQGDAPGPIWLSPK